MEQENLSNKQVIPLKNIEVLVSAIHDVSNSPAHLPKMVTFSGPSGYGKSFAAAYAMNKFDCGYLEIGSSYSITHLLDEILKELGITTKEKTIAKKMPIIVENLIETNKPIILDEFDFMVTKSRGLEIIREIHDKAGSPIILIGEELLPKKLEETERFHNRVLNWVKAEPVSLEDARNLAKLYVPKLKIEDNLLTKLVKISQGRVRRVCVNLEQIKSEATLNGWTEVNLQTWGNKKFFTGNAPAPRRV
ncbi:phage transposition protein [Candidatus Hepatincola sp. Av]